MTLGVQIIQTPGRAVGAPGHGDSAMAQTVRKKVRWKTGKRKCGSRVWKWGWVTVKQASSKPAAKPAAPAAAAEKPKAS